MNECRFADAYNSANRLGRGGVLEETGTYYAVVTPEVRCREYVKLRTTGLSLSAFR